MSWAKIHFDNYQGNYKPNDTIIGRFQCYFRSEKTLRGIKVRFAGEEHTSWMDSESYYDSHEKRHKTRTVHFSGDHQFFCREIYVYGSSSGSTTMAPGQYTYPFSFQLPSDLPGTYDCSEGYIRYSVKGIVDRPFKFDIEDEVIYFMYSPINFNYMLRDLQEPDSVGDSKDVCCWCCSSGPIELEVSLPKRAFIPGERIALGVFVSNLSNVSVDSVTAELEQRLEYHVTHPSSKTRNSSLTLSTAVANGIGAHGENEFEMILNIPNSVTVPNFRSCRLFRVDYRIKVECELPGCHMNLEAQAFPELGHIQFQAASETTRASYVQSPNGYTPSGFGGNTVGSGYPGMPQPMPGAPAIGFATSGADYPPPYPPGPALPGAMPMASDGPDDFEVVGGGPSTASGATGGTGPNGNYSKAKEAAQYDGPGVPSAPANPASAPPPSYDDSMKPNPPYPPQ